MIARCLLIATGGLLGCSPESTTTRSCSNCTITLTKVLTLRPPSDSAGFEQSSRPVMDSRGRFIVAPLAERGRIHVFDPDGRYARTIGRAGSGPDEFLRIERMFAIPGDSTLVLDRGNARMAVLDSSYHVARTVHLSALVFDVVRLRDGTLIAAAFNAGRNKTDDPYHIIGDTGIVRSFGRTLDAVVSRDAPPDVRSVAASRRGGFWSARINRYEIGYSDSASAPLVVVRREVPWFTPWTASEGAPPWFVKPNPKLTGLREDAQGRLWTLVLVAPLQWKPATNVRFQGDGPLVMPPVNDIDKYIDRIVEVIDPRSGNALASRRIPGSFTGFVGDDMIVQPQETADGEVVINVFRLSLTERPRR